MKDIDQQRVRAAAEGLLAHLSQLPLPQLHPVNLAARNLRGALAGYRPPPVTPANGDALAVAYHRMGEFEPPNPLPDDALVTFGVATGQLLLQRDTLQTPARYVVVTAGPGQQLSLVPNTAGGVALVPEPA